MYEMFLLLHSMSTIKNISEVTEPLKEQVLRGDLHMIDEMKAWLKPLGYSEAINEAAKCIPIMQIIKE